LIQSDEQNRNSLGKHWGEKIMRIEINTFQRNPSAVPDMNTDNSYDSSTSR
jgi:hypothetical protein